MSGNQLEDKIFFEAGHTLGKIAFENYEYIVAPLFFGF